MRRGFIILTIVLSCAISAFAQGDHRIDKSRSHETILHFRFDNPEFDRSYLDNEDAIAEIDRLVDSIGREAIDSVVIISQSSPEGVYEHNVQLARRRAVSIAFFMRSRYPDISRQIYSTHAGEAWARLRHYIEQDTKLTQKQKDKALSIIDSDINVGTKKWRMERLPFYRYLQQKYYRLIRYSAVCMIYYSGPELPELDIPEIEDFEYEPEIQYPLLPIGQPAVVPLDKRGKPNPKTPLLPDRRVPVMEFRTNLLIPGLNAGVEVPIGDHWSVGGNYYFPWFWPKKDNKNCYELLGWTLEGRYWFGRNREPHKRMLGHAVGLNVYGGYYDLEKNFRGMQGEFVSAGVEYRYALPLGKKRWGHLDFSITLGYLYSEGRTYDVKHSGGPLFGDDNLVKFNFFGPTKAEITLTIPIYKKNKEGRR